MANGRVAKVEDVMNIGDIVRVEVIEVADNGKISLDRLDKPDVKSEAPRADRPNNNGNRKPRRRHN
jgi:polyribonucleotide nucleotidyltransferase